MRKFFKSLAVLLALTLIVGVIPAAAADAPQLQKEKILYLGGSQGTKEDGTQCKTGSKKLVAKMIKGFDKDTMNIVLSSDDSSVVKANNKTGKIYAKSLGTTTVNVKIYNAAEEEIFNQDLKVKVKKNASEVTVRGIANGDSFKVGQTVDVSLPRVGVDTDERKLAVDKTDVAEIKDGEKARTYTVKFLKEGEATFTATAYQSSKYPGTTATATVKVSVTKPAPTAVNVVASNKIELVFDTNVEAAGIYKDAKEIPYNAIYYYVNEKTPVYLNAVEKVEAKENKVTVTLFSTLKADTTYYIDLAGVTNEFSLTKCGPKDVVSVQITKTTVVKDNAETLTYILKNENGIDITKSALEAGGTVTMTQTEYNADLQTTTANVYTIKMWTKDARANIKAAYKFVDAKDNYKEYTADGEGSILCVDESPLVFKKTVWTLSPRGSAAVSASETKLKKYFALNETNLFVNIALIFTKDGKDLAPLTIGSTYDEGTIKIWTPDANNAIIDSDGRTIKGNKEGFASVFVGYTKNGADKVIDVLNVEVKAATKVNSITLKTENDKKTLNTNTALAKNDKVVLIAEVKDQYGDPINPTGAMTLTQVDGSVKERKYTGTPAINPVEKGKFSIEINAGDFEANNANKAVNAAFYVKADNVTSGTAYFSVMDKNANAGSVVFSATGTSLDTALADNTDGVTTDNKKISLSIKKSDGGYYTGDVNVSEPMDSGEAFLLKKNANKSVVSGAGFCLEILKNGTRIDITSEKTNNGNGPTFDQFIDVNQALGTIDVYPYFVDGGVFKKLDAGTYTFRLFEYKLSTTPGDTKGYVQNPQTINITINDNQVPVSYKQIAQTVAAKDDVSNCFEYYFNGKKISRTVDYSDVNGNTEVVYVKNAVVTISVTLKNAANTKDGITVSGTFDVKVPIGTAIKNKN